MVFLLTLSTLWCVAQPLDSLWKVWGNPALHDTVRLEALYNFAWDGFLYDNPDSAYQLMELQIAHAQKTGWRVYEILGLKLQGEASSIAGDDEKGLKYLEKGLDLARQENDASITALLLRTLGKIQEALGLNRQAINAFEEAIAIDSLTNNRNGSGAAYNWLGTLYQDLGQIENALYCYDQSFKIKAAQHDTIGMADVLNSMGSVYNDLMDYDNAIASHLEALAYAQKMGDSETIVSCHIFLGISEQRRNDLEKAEYYFRTALTYAEENNMLMARGMTHANLGSLFLETSQWEAAKKELLQALDIALELDNPFGITACYNNLGHLAWETGDLTTAQHYGEQSLAIAKGLGYPQRIVMATELLKGVYKDQGNFKAALEMQELYFTMRDSVNNEETRQITIRQQVQFEYDKKEAIANAEHEAALAKQEAIAEEESKRQNIIIVAVSIGLALVILFAIFLMNRFHVIRKQKNIIEAQKNEVELQKELVEEKNKEITDSIAYAKRLQDAILPPRKLVKEYLQESFILYKPKAIVAGDFYWMYTQGDLVFFAAADCTGHGVPGAMVSVVCSNALNRAVKEMGILDPGKLLDKTRELVVQRFEQSEDEVKDGMDISLCCLNTTTRELHWAGANNPIYFVQAREGTTTLNEIKGTKQPIGRVGNPQPFTIHTIQLQQGDVLYTFTDGFADQFGGPLGKKFKYKPFKALLTANAHLPMEEQVKLLDETIDAWKGELEQIDDICVIGVRV